MENVQILTKRESLTIDIMKAIAVLSVITAHVVSVSDTDILSNVISSCWSLFARVGVIIFFVIGGFLYHRHQDDSKAFWKKEICRIILPWFFCSAITYGIAVVLGRDLGFSSYLKWIFGSGTWYYYFTIYTLFLFAFKHFYNKDMVLSFLIVVQSISLVCVSFGKTTTPSIEFLTDYLNPLHWIGYFSLGVLLRKYRIDLLLRRQKYVIAIACLTAALSMAFLYRNQIFTYFHFISSVFCISCLIIAAAVSYHIADRKIAVYLGKIGTCSYCIYLLHMQIVQGILSKIPESIFKLLLSPFLGLGIMLLLILAGIYICNKIPFGKTLKMLVGL